MPTNNVKRLAELSGYSESVVKRALGNYAGVRRQTKEHILALAEENGIRLSARRASVGVVMPSVPSFFWKRLADSIRSYAERRGLSVKFFFFSMIADESGALGCLEAALSSGISVLLTALPDTDAVRTYVKALADELTVILLDEDLAVENAFFVGEDSFAAGRRLAELCLENVELSDEVLIYSPRARKGARMEGFCRTLLENRSGLRFRQIEVGEEDEQSVYVIARALHAMGEIGNCIYCPAGHITAVINALSKLRLAHPMCVVGFDINKRYIQAATLSLRKIVMNRDLVREGEIAVELAEQVLGGSLSRVKRNFYVKSIEDMEG